MTNKIVPIYIVIQLLDGKWGPIESVWSTPECAVNECRKSKQIPLHVVVRDLNSNAFSGELRAFQNEVHQMLRTARTEND